MTQEEILDYNRRCAEFLGFKYKNQAKFWAIYPLDNNSYLRQLGYVRMDNLKFHSDWNWIMEVVEAICREGFRKYSCSNEEHSRCVFTDMSILYQNHEFGGGNIIADSGKQKTEKEAVLQAINQFLIWYNSQKS